MAFPGSIEAAKTSPGSSSSSKKCSASSTLALIMMPLSGTRCRDQDFIGQMRPTSDYSKWLSLSWILTREKEKGFAWENTIQSGCLAIEATI